MRWLLRRLLSDDEFRAIENDLAELYEFRRGQDGERAAARWLRWQRALYPLHLLWDRAPSVLWPVASGSVMAGIASDLKHGLRSLLRAPGLAATIVLTVGLGLGATTAMVAVTQAV